MDPTSETSKIVSSDTTSGIPHCYMGPSTSELNYENFRKKSSMIAFSMSPMNSSMKITIVEPVKIDKL